MPKNQVAPEANGVPKNKTDFDIDIVVKEQRIYPWPEDDSNIIYGRASKQIRLYFEPFLDLITRTRKDYFWKFFYTNSETGKNYLAEYPNILDQLELLFEDELGTRYSEEQLKILLDSQIVIIAVSKKTNSIAGYFSSSYMPAKTIPGLSIPLTIGNHGVISGPHQRYKIGVTMGAISMFHGQRFRDLFNKVSCVLRTNNRYLYNPLTQTGTVYRSDRLSGHQLTNDERQAVSAIRYMHNNIYGLSDVPLYLDRPLDIKHSFDPSVTIEGLSSNQIVYIFCITSPARSILKLVARRQRRKPQHASKED